MQIWKFEIGDGKSLAAMPKGARVLSVGVQDCRINGVRNARIMVWAMIDPSAEIVQHRFPVYGTGHEIDAEDMGLFIGTVFTEHLVCHVFDGGEV